MKKLDLQYLCTNLGNLSGMPVRLYEGDEQVFYYSTVRLPTAPYEVYWPDIRAITDHVGYVYTPYHSYFGVLNFGSGRIVMGPNRQMTYAEQELRQMAFDLDVPIAEVPAFVDGLKKLEPKPLTMVLQTLCTVNHVLNEGETLSLTDVAIVNVEQKRMVEAVGKEEASRTLDEADGMSEKWLHNTMEIEEYMLSLVQKGDVAGLNAFFANVPAIQGGQMVPDSLRQVKNLFVVTATLVSRAAIRGGMDPNEALTLSDLYIQQCEPSSDLDYITNLNYRLVMDYAERMQRLRYGNVQSKLVIEVNNYVRQHLSEPITVEDLAKCLCRGRSRLSTDFKKRRAKTSPSLSSSKRSRKARSCYDTPTSPRSRLPSISASPPKATSPAPSKSTWARPPTSTAAQRQADKKSVAQKTRLGVSATDEEVCAVARCICREIRSTDIPNEKSPNGGILTLSVGVANVTITNKTDTILEIANYADKALYYAKNAGRHAIYELVYEDGGTKDSGSAKYNKIDF